MATKKASTRKKVAKKAATRKKPVARKAAAKKKPAAKKAVSRKKSAAKKKAPSRKKTVAKKKAAAKKPAVKKTASKKKAAAKKPVAKQTAAAKQPAARKKVVAKKPAARKKAPSRKPSSGAAGSVHGFAPYKRKAREEYMSPKMLEHFGNILLSWKQELMEEVDRTVVHMKDEAANFPDPNDRATQESDFSLELRTRDRERKLLRKIDQALSRVEDGSYGYCEETGDEIGLKLLEARPVATLSVEAQERRERQEKQYRDRDDR